MKQLGFITGSFAKEDGERGFFNYADPENATIEFTEDRLVNISTRLFTRTGDPIKPLLDSSSKGMRPRPF